MVREATCKLLEMAKNKDLSWETLARECLAFMSESDVRCMAEANDWIEDSEEEDEEQPIELTEEEIASQETGNRWVDHLLD